MTPAPDVTERKQPVERPIGRLVGWTLIVVGFVALCGELVPWSQGAFAPSIGYGPQTSATSRSTPTPNATATHVAATHVAARAAASTATAEVEIIEYSDFQCPYCAQVQGTLGRVLVEYRGQVRLIYRHFPLDFHHQARHASLAAECAREQGKFWEMHDALYRNRAGLSKNVYEQLATQIRLDDEQFRQCMDEERYAQRVMDDVAAGEAAGVHATPTFIINGRLLVGAASFDEFRQIIDAELADFTIADS